MDHHHEILIVLVRHHTHLRRTTMGSSVQQPLLHDAVGAQAQRILRSSTMRLCLHSADIDGRLHGWLVVRCEHLEGLGEGDIAQVRTQLSTGGAHILRADRLEVSDH